MGKSLYKKEEKEFIKEINKAKKEWQMAQEFFQEVNDPALIEYAIYLEKAARAKYMYFINMAKKENIQLKFTNILNNKRVI